MHVRPFNDRVRWKGAEIAGVDLRPFEKENGRQPGRLDWQGWCRGKFRLQLRLIGHCGGLWDQQHSSAGQHEQSFPEDASIFCKRTCKICVAMVLWSKYRRGNEVILGRGDDWEWSLDLQGYKLGETAGVIKMVETTLFYPKHTLSDWVGARDVRMSSWDDKYFFLKSIFF